MTVAGVWRAGWDFVALDFGEFRGARGAIEDLVTQMSADERVPVRSPGLHDNLTR
ncbi:hypothetical protein ACL02U_22735 [Streptomyces sp. MS06]|uniref:hypothetical protein n=1 Tax=Streptomyces sp. MS06 TaxID=3385974 RepID=UPI0039A3AAFF